MIASWTYITPVEHFVDAEPTVVASSDAAALGSSSANAVIESWPQVFSLSSTPRSESELSTFPVMPSTFEDAEAWHSTPSGSILEHDNWAPRQVTDKTKSYHAETRLLEGQGILIDPGSVANLSGDKWGLDVAKLAMNNGRQPKQTKRDRPLRVSGVGHGSEICSHNVILPVCLKRMDGTFQTGNFETPSVAHSELPGLMGLTSLTNRRAVIDFVTKQMHFLGPGDCDLASVLPPGSESFQLVTAPSGHLVLPCTHYKEFDEKQKNGDLTLDAQPVSLLAAAAPEAGGH